MSRMNPLPHAGAPRIGVYGTAAASIIVTSHGIRAMRAHGLAVNRARLDAVTSGSDILIRDCASGALYSATGQHHGVDALEAEIVFDAMQASIERRFSDLSTRLELRADGANAGELALLTLTNRADRTRRFEIASVLELALADARADASHPAYSKMFVVTEARAGGRVLAAHRRADGADAHALHALQTLRVEGTAIRAHGYETDRAALRGRGHALAHADFLSRPLPHAGTSGIVLDPVFCLRAEIELDAGAEARILVHTLVGEQPARLDQTLATASTTSIDDLMRPPDSDPAIDADTEDALQELAGALIAIDPAWRADGGTRRRQHGGQPELWAHSISGDRPIVLLELDATSQSGLLGALAQAQAAWHARGLDTDLVVIDRGDDIDTLRAWLAANGPPRDAGIACHALAASALPAGARDLIAGAAAAVLDARDGDLAAHVARHEAPRAIELPPAELPRPDVAVHRANRAGLHADNGLGGFAADGAVYVIDLYAEHATPMPWVNVIANPDFGCIVSERGAGCCWAINSQQNLITEWHNDPVADPHDEAIYLRDLDDGCVWCPTPGPIDDGGGCRVRHGIGWTAFERSMHGIQSTLTLGVDARDPVRISELRLRNDSARRRRIDVTAFVRFALAATGEPPSGHARAWRDDASGALFAQNPWRAHYDARVAFFDLGEGTACVGVDADDFLGPRRDLSAPAALFPDAAHAAQESRETPAAVARQSLELAAGESIHLRLLLGQAADADAARSLVARHRARAADAAREDAKALWPDLLDVLEVATPDPAQDILINHWLLYQVLSCRMWARTAFYQASGAWGFRDQLQDAMALCVGAPHIARAHILRAASRQFPEGDVQHWWLPPDGAGVRTHIVDDRLWLPFVAAHYVATTGDATVLDEPLPFLDAPQLAADAVDSFTTPAVGAEAASLLEHCARAIEASLATGPHGLPLFGRGDWNDGMNRVGKDGRGESVWMAWFLIATIKAFAPLAETHGADARAAAWRTRAAALESALDVHAWDGQWWLRGWYDDGATLGSASDEECRIDSIAQSWSVLAGRRDARARMAMDAVDRLCVRRDAELIALLDPPFDTGAHDPGYIKAYPPGLRENGGQYTHGVIWSALAFAELGDGDKAGELLAMLNPIHHGGSAEDIARYKVEPYVSCADLYTAEGHLGRGGWTWYTGSAAWLYRAIVEWQLGLRVEGENFTIDPCIPHRWESFRITLRRGTALYRITVRNPRHVARGVVKLRVDGTACATLPPRVACPDDARTHEVEVELG